MNARDRRIAWAAVAAVGVLGSGSAEGQAPSQGKAPATAPKGAAAAPRLDTGGVQSKVVRLPTNPGDAVATVNGETITRQQLADEAFVRYGVEVLDAMVSRKLIDQAIRPGKIEVTAQEIDAEIDRYANNIAGISREAWLSKLAEEKKISPAQYKNDIVYPGLALKKLAQGRVQITEKDIKDAFEAHYGDKLKCRIIMTAHERAAVEIWQELKKNPGGFAHMATNDPRSMDEATKPTGGMLDQLLTRHAYPRTFSDSAFLQLVDGDPEDKDLSHKPKDGAISGPIQVAESAWVIVKREGHIPAQPHNPKDPTELAKMKEMIFDAKLKEAMSEVFQEIVHASQVDNKLTGQVKLARETQDPAHRVDGDVKLMSNPNAAVPKRDDAASLPEKAAAGAAAAASKTRAVSDEDRATREALLKGSAPK